MLLEVQLIAWLRFVRFHQLAHGLPVLEVTALSGATQRPVNATPSTEVARKWLGLTS